MIRQQLCAARRGRRAAGGGMCVSSGARGDAVRRDARAVDGSRRRLQLRLTNVVALPSCEPTSTQESTGTRTPRTRVKHHGLVGRVEAHVVDLRLLGVRDCRVAAVGSNGRGAERPGQREQAQRARERERAAGAAALRGLCASAALCCCCAGGGARAAREYSVAAAHTLVRGRLSTAAGRLRSCRSVARGCLAAPAAAAAAAALPCRCVCACAPGLLRCPLPCRRLCWCSRDQTV